MNKWYLYFLTGFLLSLVLLFTAVELVAFDISHYLSSYQRYDIPQSTGMDMASLEAVTREIMDYLRGRQQELNPRALVHGKERAVLGERERQHMVDVKNLFIAGRHIRNGGLVLLLGLGAVLAWKRKDWHRRLAKLCIGSLAANLGVLLLVGAAMLVDFNQVFTWFHLLFFTNDLWMLSESSLLLRMVPEIFFFHTALKVGAIYLGSLILLAVAGVAWLRWQPQS